MSHNKTLILTYIVNFAPDVVRVYKVVNYDTIVDGFTFPTHKPNYKDDIQYSGYCTPLLPFMKISPYLVIDYTIFLSDQLMIVLFSAYQSPNLRSLLNKSITSCACFKSSR